MNIIKETCAMVKATWKKEFALDWVLIFIGAAIISMGEWWFLLAEHTWENFKLVLGCDAPGAALMFVGAFTLWNEYYARKENEGA